MKSAGHVPRTKQYRISRSRPRLHGWSRHRTQDQSRRQAKPVTSQDRAVPDKTVTSQDKAG
eukprot:1624786-Rhodomonas_salina.1